jgi:hypothetical protein
MFLAVCMSFCVGVIAYLIGYQVSATRIWKIFIDLSKQCPDDKLSDWTDILEQKYPKIFGSD